MNHDKTKKSRSTPSGGIIAWLYELLFPPKNTAADESSISPARETIPEHDSGRAEKLFAQMQQELNRPKIIGGRMDWIRQLCLIRLFGDSTPLQILLAECSRWNSTGGAG